MVHQLTYPWCLDWAHGGEAFDIGLVTNLIGPPIIAGVALFAAFWVTAGFQRNKNLN